MGFLDFLFPKYCVGCKAFGAYLCGNCFTNVSFDVESVCLLCNKHAIAGKTHPFCQRSYAIDGVLASVVYKGIIKRLIYQFKYQPYVRDLESVLVDFFYEGLIQNEQFNRLLEKESILIPIPLHTDKERRRGYNHAEILSKSLGKRLNLETKNILKRGKRTKIQSELNREERLKNITGAFSIDSVGLRHLFNKQVLLVDDIITSGATMREAANMLKRAGVQKVWGIALAHGK